MSKKKKPGKAMVPPHERTEAEIAFMKDFLARKEAKRQLPECTLKFTDDKTANIQITHGDPDIANALMLDAFGTTSDRFFDGMALQLAHVGKQNFDFMLSVIHGIEPKDEIEAMLAAQMAAVHLATMTLGCRLSRADTIDQQNSAEKAFNKLARTFASQMEALNRHRGKGQQKMTVEHVHVYEGGQAIVGPVQGGKGKNGGQPHEPTNGQGAPVPCQDP